MFLILVRKTGGDATPKSWRPRRWRTTESLTLPGRSFSTRAEAEKFANDKGLKVPGYAIDIVECEDPNPSQDRRVGREHGRHATTLALQASASSE
jgi:hypothetical protein